MDNCDTNINLTFYFTFHLDNLVCVYERIDAIRVNLTHVFIRYMEGERW